MVTPVAVTGGLLALHLGFGLVRFPVGSLKKRAESIALYQELGPDAWCYRLADDETRRLARWLLATVPADEVLLCAGESRGALQMFAPLLFPRLMVTVSAQNGDRDRAGRRIFTGVAPWLPPSTTGVPVLVGAVDQLRLEYR